MVERLCDHHGRGVRITVSSATATATATTTITTGGANAAKSRSLGSTLSSGGVETVRLPCLSVNQPFASLLARGVKTLESRSTNILAPLANQRVLLHVSQKTYDDGGKHREVLGRGGLYGSSSSRNTTTTSTTSSSNNDENIANHNAGNAAAAAAARPMSRDDIARATSLPKGWSRGSVGAVLTLGRTRRVASLAARSSPAVQRAACLPAAAMGGEYLTEVTSARWLLRPVPMRGRPGVFYVDVPKSALPLPQDASHHAQPAGSSRSFT